MCLREVISKTNFFIAVSRAGSGTLILFQVKSTILHLFDVGSPSRMSYKEKQDTFRTLQKFLTQVT
jgi:hypothetical protein